MKHQWGLIAPEDRREMSQAIVGELLERAPSVEFSLTLKALHQVWQSIDQQIEQLEVQWKQQAPQTGSIRATTLSGCDHG
ncbi:MAG: hypothetical protein KME17_15825 [Cyanosarcina radialis HA8281-LM2]|nr:hypothetical protein [Cyanosarcina radialis HA8281-LM2]